MYKKDNTVWTQKNGTMSDKSAREEYNLTQEEIIHEIRLGKLQYRENNMHGNPYFKLIRSEIETLVAKKYGKSYVNIQNASKELKELNRELNSAKRKISVLEKRKAEILIFLDKNTSAKLKNIPK